MTMFQRLLMRRLLALVVALAACGPSTDKPAGTTNDPVLVCERVADVCRLDKSRLGVCIQEKPGATFTCQSQH